MVNLRPRGAQPKQQIGRRREMLIPVPKAILIRPKRVAAPSQLLQSPAQDQEQAPAIPQVHFLSVSQESSSVPLRPVLIRNQTTLNMLQRVN